ncbi:response regulator [Pantoea sp. SOD02]|uniref:response regulator n=1 Tax=Pantoea sp. SOD02 TaxID=2970818 RepID=UPI0021574348|nr:transporter substrate-binding domain-containing protein [Pantoea sp. SOD02]UVC29816.1 transporter substrate-binding domain-containing protein [Pantoea sp. SOD02]
MRYLLILLLLIATSSWSDSTPPQRMQIQSILEFAPIDIPLSQTEWNKLRKQRELRVGVWSIEIPPFNTYPDMGVFAGINADYLHLISTNLNLRPRVYHYKNQQQALAALSAGRIDALFYTAGEKTPDNSDFIDTVSFVPNQPALVSKVSNILSGIDRTRPMRLAVAENYLDDADIKTLLPLATITRYFNDQVALSSVVSGDNDVYLGNLTTANYLIERTYSNDLVINDVFSAKDRGTRLILRKSSSELYSAINKFINSMRPSPKQLILNNWVAGIDYLTYRSPIEFTEREQAWMASHKNVRVLYDPFYAPYTFYDNTGKVNGISIDLLRQVHFLTGLNFIPVSGTDHDDFEDVLKDKRGDLVAGLTINNNRRDNILFSRTYMQSPWVLVVPNKSDADTKLTAGMRVAVPYYNPMLNYIRKNFPDVKIVITNNAGISLQMVADGKVDASLNDYGNANYMVSRFFTSQLKIGERLTTEPAVISFGVGHDEPELLSILNKVLDHIPARNVSLIVNKWQQGTDVKLNTWTLYNRQFYWLIGLSVLLIALGMARLFSMRRDMVKRKRTQEKMAEELAFRETLLNGSPSPVYVINADGATLNQNRAFIEFFSAEKSQFQALPLYDQRHPLSSMSSVILPLLKEPVQTPQVNFTHQAVLNDGINDHVIKHWATAYADANGNTAGLICGWEDVTDTDKLLRDLSEAKDRAEKSSKAKTSFLATMSHEIRTPISAIIGLLELTVIDQQHKSKDDPIMLAWESAQSLLGLIGDILDMAKIESGQLELEPKWVDLNQLVTPTVPVFNGLARVKNLTLNVRSQGESDYEVYIDPLRFKQVLYNFLSNALKFTDEGGVSVVIDTRLGADGRIHLELTISDTGAGISPEDQKKLFQPYMQLSEGRKQAGSGLGLFIAAELIQQMSGKVDMLSAPGKGTSVIIALDLPARPYHAPVLPQLAQDEGEFSQYLSILIVDDHATNRMLLKTQLQRLEHRIDEAADGEEALALWRDNHYDLIITDCNMPGIDGLELTRIIRQQDADQLIFGLTANAQSEERERCLAAGMNECLFKPLRLKPLEKVLNNIVPRQRDNALEAIIDMEELKVLTNNNHELIVSILKLAIQGSAEDRKMLETLFRQRENKDLARALHRVAGSLQVIGLRRGEMLAVEIEEQCLSPETDLAELSEPFEQLMQVMEEFEQLAQAFISLKQ